MLRPKPLRRPEGLSQISSTFGCIFEYITFLDNRISRLDPAFEDRFIVSLELPYPLISSWENKKIFSIRCHNLLADRFQFAFSEIARNNLSEKAKFLGGCFHFRRKRNGHAISTHSWGIAIDINPQSNPAGQKGDMDPEIVAIFKKLDFIWGGDWPGKALDPMHFQYCSGY